MYAIRSYYAVTEALARQRSILRAIEALNAPGRALRPFEFRVSEELDALVPESSIADPEFPLDADRLARHLVTDEDREPASRTLITLAAILIIALLLAAGWRWTPLGEWIDLKAAINQLGSLRGEWLAPLVVSAIYIRITSYNVCYTKLLRHPQNASGSRKPCRKQ